jgi:NAD(P)-dependent dehydrogenase (short-subunit alcohol dehydrogenase family)
MSQSSPHPFALDATPEIPLAIADAFSVKEKVVLVTGAGGWIGHMIAQTFAANGSRVALSDRPGEHLNEVAAHLSPLGAQVFPADLTNVAELEALVANTVAHFGRLDVLVHCGAIPVSGPALSTHDDFDRLFHTNVRSSWSLARFAAPHLEKTAGNIAFISSVNGHRPMFPGTLYAATKAALLSLTREMAIEFAAKNIRVNSVSPGAIINIRKNIDGMRKKLAPAYFADYEKMILKNAETFGKTAQPLPLGGRPVDVAMACLYLASPAARFVTSADILVDGGLLFNFLQPKHPNDDFWTKLRTYLKSLPPEAWIDTIPDWVAR